MSTVAISAGAGRGARAAGILVALGVAALLTVNLSLAAFTDTATNAGNAFAAGEVSISQSRTGSAMFDVAGIVPGWSATEEVTVTNASTVPTEVALYLSDYDDSGLAPFLAVTVTRDGAPLYSGTLDALPRSFAAATLNAEAAGATTTYSVTVELPTGQPGVDGAQGADATVAFTWEARSVGS